jgi:hypothetical protein
MNHRTIGDILETWIIEEHEKIHGGSCGRCKIVIPRRKWHGRWGNCVIPFSIIYLYFHFVVKKKSLLPFKWKHLLRCIRMKLRSLRNSMKVLNSSSKSEYIARKKKLIWMMNSKLSLNFSNILVSFICTC